MALCRGNTGAIEITCLLTYLPSRFLTNIGDFYYLKSNLKHLYGLKQSACERRHHCKMLTKCKHRIAEVHPTMLMINTRSTRYSSTPVLKYSGTRTILLPRFLYLVPWPEPTNKGLTTTNAIQTGDFNFERPSTGDHCITGAIEDSNFDLCAISVFVVLADEGWPQWRIINWPPRLYMLY